MNASLIGQLLVSGMCSAFILLLTSLGLVIIMGYMKIVNLAHTEMLMSGAFICYYLYAVLHIPFVITLILAYLICFFFGMLLERVIIRHFYGKMSETLLATYGISIILKQLALIVFGKSYKQVEYPVSTVFHMGSIYIESYKLILCAISMIALAATLILINKTTMGLKIRSTTQNRTMTECLGIDTRKVDSITFSHGMGLAGLAGAAIAPLTAITYSLGESWLTNTFMNVVMGGVSSLFGTVASSFIIQEAISLISGYSNSVTAQIVVLIIVIAIVRFKPEGLFTPKGRR
ncbi:MAG: inner-rane translocator [Herbinix sp.]|jgi:urea transport system permease protein|nr:inner-rane translocator [Herbinix sp.]